MRMSGIGEVLAPVPLLPPCAIVLVRPKAAVPTGQVFAKMPDKNGTPMTALPDFVYFDTFVNWLRNQRNDMQAAAEQIAPEISAVLAKLQSLPGVNHAGMSGSGATCFGLVKDMATARHVARIVQVSQMEWWVAPAEVLGTDQVF
jgi:4-diphosphocytidyl-2-C-methyl-D-erythritol kinase